MKADHDRFFIDIRGGCIAVRDRTLTDPEYPGLHADTPGVVWYEHGENRMKTCPTCGGSKQIGWHLRDGAEDRAEDALLEWVARKDEWGAY